ncbi:unnamed protein product [Prunus armeniaca]|uniref:NAC domain-containing protein n=1 Tax=Prunus armeniaca TaxID=36596 RepID=A0A6J5WGB3_PRUAR|nr:unnamed protein product [Prunus armeniaca]CAB4300810.1 unnamed protein product [Prunus armeniaca]
MTHQAMYGQEETLVGKLRTFGMKHKSKTRVTVLWLVVAGGMRSTTTEEWLLPLLRGFRFHPPEEEMVNLLRKKMEGQGSQTMPEIDYKPWNLSDNESISLFLRFLKQMMRGKASQACHIIPEIDVCKYEPSDLAELLFPDSPYQPRMWFSFSRPHYKSINSLRYNRATKKGFWKITGKPREIKSQQLSKSVTCKKRTLTFHEGRVSKSTKTDWVMQEYYLIQTEPGSIPNQLTDPGIGGYVASNSEDDQAPENNMIPEADRHLADKEPEHDLPGSGNHDAGEPGGCVSSDCDDMIQELSAQPGEYLDLPFPPPEPPEPGNASVPSPIGNNDSSLPYKNNITTTYDSKPVSNTASNFKNQTKDERTSEVYSQPEEDPESFLQLKLDDYTWLSRILQPEQGNLLHANNSIGCNELQSPYPETAALFPQSS